MTSLLVLLFVLYSAEVFAQENSAPLQAAVNQASSSSVSNARSRSRSKAKPGPKSKNPIDRSRWKRRAGFKFTMGGGVGFGAPLGASFLLNGSLGFFYRNYAIQLAIYPTAAGGSQKNEEISRSSFLVAELEMYRQIRRTPLDTYFFFGGGLALLAEETAEATRTNVGPAGLAGLGVNLWGGDVALSKNDMYFGTIAPYMGIHLRAPLIVYATPSGAGLAGAGLLVLEISYQ